MDKNTKRTRPSQEVLRALTKVDNLLELAIEGGVHFGDDESGIKRDNEKCPEQDAMKIFDSANEILDPYLDTEPKALSPEQRTDYLDDMGKLHDLVQILIEKSYALSFQHLSEHMNHLTVHFNQHRQTWLDSGILDPTDIPSPIRPHQDAF